MKNRYQYTGETYKLQIYLVLWIDQLGSSTVWFWNTYMIHFQYLHKPWSKLLAKVAAKIWIFEFHWVYSWCWSQSNGWKSKKIKILYNSKRWREETNDIVHISACGHATDLVQYFMDSSCIGDSKRYWNLSVSGLWAELYAYWR